MYGKIRNVYENNINDIILYEYIKNACCIDIGRIATEQSNH